MKVCPGCGASVIDTAKFCIECGFNIKKHEEAQREKFCPECGTKISGGKFCPECGYSLAAALAVSDGGSAPELGGSMDFGDEWLDGIADETDAAVSEKQAEDERARLAEKFAAFEYEQFPDGAFGIISLKQRSALNITVPDGVVSIGEDAFAESDVISVTLPDGLIKIGDRAFKGCKTLSAINLPVSLMIVGDEAFAGCEMLDAELPASVKRVGADAMKGTLPDIRRQQELARERALATAAADFKKFCEENEVDGTVLEKYNGAGGNVIVPEGITAVHYPGFSLSKGDITGITLPKSFETYAPSAFERCEKLSFIATSEPSVVPFDGNWYSISGNRLIKYASGKPDTSYTVPRGITTIDTVAFDCCGNLTSVSFPDTVTTIKERAFSFCDKLIEISIPQSVTSIDELNFSYCPRLTVVRVDEGNQSYSSVEGNLCTKDGRRLLRGVITSSDGSYAPPTGVTEIGNYAFYFHDAVTAVSIPDGVRSIGKDAFAGCRHLVSVSIPESVTEIGNGAFHGCALRAIKLPHGITRIGEGTFELCDELCEIDIPSGVTELASSAFYACDKLSRVNIPYGVRHIGEQAFAFCEALTEIELPRSVTVIGDGAFEDCSRLTVKVSRDAYNKAGENAFSGVKEVIVI